MAFPPTGFIRKCRDSPQPPSPKGASLWRGDSQAPASLTANTRSQRCAGGYPAGAGEGSRRRLACGAVEERRGPAAQAAGTSVPPAPSLGDRAYSGPDPAGSRSVCEESCPDALPLGPLSAALPGASPRLLHPNHPLHPVF